MTKVVILGAGGHARETLWLIRDAAREGHGLEPVGFIDEDPGRRGEIVNGLPVLGGFEWFEAKAVPDLRVLCAVGSPRARKGLVEKAARLGLRFCSVVHPSVRMSEDVEIGPGSAIAAGCVLTTQVRIGSHVILNVGCTVSHDSVLGDFCTLAPGVHIPGRVRLGDGVDFGIGAVSIQGVTVGAWSVIGAGAAVVSDIPAGVTAAGVPARIIKVPHPGDSK